MSDAGVMPCVDSGGIVAESQVAPFNGYANTSNAGKFGTMLPFHGSSKYLQQVEICLGLAITANVYAGSEPDLLSGFLAPEMSHAGRHAEPFGKHQVMLKAHIAYSV